MEALSSAILLFEEVLLDVWELMVIEVVVVWWGVIGSSEDGIWLVD